MCNLCPEPDIFKASAHALRVGTCSALYALGLSKERIDVHCNWSDNSNSYRTYIRTGVTLSSFDKAFYFDALPIMLQATLPES